MNKIIISTFILIILGFNIIGCNKQVMPQRTNETEEKQDDKKESKNIVDVNEESKVDLVANLNKYFGIDIKKENFEYFISKDIEDDELEDREEGKELNDIHIIAKAKEKLDESGVSDVIMKYNKDTKVVDYMKIYKTEDKDELATLTMETAIPISEKFIRDNNLVLTDNKLKPEAITNNKGIAIMEFSYMLNGYEEDIKIGINALTKEVRMFEID